MNLKTIFWPWGRIKELEIENNELAAECDDLDAAFDCAMQLACHYVGEVVAKEAVLLAASRDFGLAALALSEIADTVAAVKVPNGTTKKLGRMAQDTIGMLAAELTPQYLDLCRTARTTELEATAEYEAAGDTSEPLEAEDVAEAA